MAADMINERVLCVNAFLSHESIDLEQTLDLTKTTRGGALVAECLNQSWEIDWLLSASLLINSGRRNVAPIIR